MTIRTVKPSFRCAYAFLVFAWIALASGCVSFDTGWSGMANAPGLEPYSGWGSDRLEERKPHPQPRVIIDVDRVRGPREKKAVVAKLRSSLWGKVVACYRLGAYENQALKGEANIRLEVKASGRVIGARKRSGSMRNRKVVRCWLRTLRKLEFPAARRGATVDMRIWVAPGDKPVGPPPEE